MFSHNFSPIQNLKEALYMSPGMYCIIRFSETVRLSAFKSPSNLSILLGRDAVPGDGGGAPPASAQAQEKIQEALLRLGLRHGPSGMRFRISGDLPFKKYSQPTLLICVAF